MSDNDLEQIARTWLEEGPTVMPNRGLSAALEQVHVTEQRRAWWPARRIPDMHIYARVAIGVAAVTVLAVVGINLLTVNGGIVAGPTPSPAASAMAAPLPSPSNSPAPPSASAPSQPTPTPDPEAVRQAAAAWFTARAASEPSPKAYMGNLRGARAAARDRAESWSRYTADLMELQVPADTAADLQELIRRASVVQELEVANSTAASYADLARLVRPLRKAQDKYYSALDRIKCDLNLWCNNN